VENIHSHSPPLVLTGISMFVPGPWYSDVSRASTKSFSLESSPCTVLNSPGHVNTTCTIPWLLRVTRLWCATVLSHSSRRLSRIAAAPDSVTVDLIRDHTQVDARGGCLGASRISAALRSFFPHTFRGVVRMPMTSHYLAASIAEVEV
jgi:hypothetical protein